MDKREQLPEYSEIRTLLMQTEIALNENRYEEVLAILNKINPDEMATLSVEELQAVGNLIKYISGIAEEKKSMLISQLKAIQAGKNYL